MVQKTTRAIIISTMRDYSAGDYVSPGELFREAQINGYRGTQQDLLNEANELAAQRVLDAKTRGRMQNTWYKLTA